MAEETLAKNRRNVYTEHLETASPDSSTAKRNEGFSDQHRVSYAVEVSYGYSGVRGLVKSPYVFGAALLASMGGFSYGYGMVIYLKHQYSGTQEANC
jgi:hypothetical protein